MCVATKFERKGEISISNFPKDTSFSIYEFLSYFQQRKLPNAGATMQAVIILYSRLHYIIFRAINSFFRNYFHLTPRC